MRRGGAGGARGRRRAASGPGRCLAAALASGWAATASCAGTEGERADVLRRDSAGVEIVENAAPQWGRGEAWAVSPEPVLSVGRVEGEDPYVFSYVRSAALLSGGGVAVLDRDAAELRLFGPDGVHRATAGGEGEGPGEFRFPDRVLVGPGDSLIVIQSFPPRATLFTPGGTFVRTWSVEGASAVRAVTDSADLLALHQRVSDRYDGYERATATVLRLSEPGRLDTLVAFPGFDGFFRREGNAVLSERVPFGRTGLAAFGADRVHVGNGDRWEVATHALEDGTLLRRTRLDRSPRPITDEAWERDWEAYLASLPPDFLERRGDAVRESQARAHRLETMPAWDGLLVDPTGHLWVRRYAPSWETSQAWDVLDPSGRWLGTVSLPASLEVLEIGRDRVLGTARDELDVTYVRVHALTR